MRTILCVMKSLRTTQLGSALSALTIAAVGAYLVRWAVTHSSVFDDAHMYVRYADHVAAGQGYSNTTGV